MGGGVSVFRVRVAINRVKTGDAPARGVADGHPRDLRHGRRLAGAQRGDEAVGVRPQPGVAPDAQGLRLIGKERASALTEFFTMTRRGVRPAAPRT